MDTGKINMLLSELGEVLNLERVTAYDDQCGHCILLKTTVSMFCS